ncbi:unnamed protein product, partial [Strongylus vulgaris]
MSLSGSFSLAEAHSWLSLIVPGVPSKPPSTDTVTVNYQSTSPAGTQLQTIYSKGMISFRSDSVSTIAVIREIISEETTNRQIKVQISCGGRVADFLTKRLSLYDEHYVKCMHVSRLTAQKDILDLNDASIDHCLKRMHPRMTHLLNLEKRKLMAAALKLKYTRFQELEANCSDTSFLSEQNKKILENYDQIFQDAEKDSMEETNICGIYESLLLNRARLNGQNARGKIDALRNLLLNDYSLEN